MILKRIGTAGNSQPSQHEQPDSWRQKLLKTAAILLTTATFLASAPLASHAVVQSPEKSHDGKTVSTSTVVANPDSVAVEVLKQNIEKARAQDPAGFDARLRLIESSKSVTKYVTSFKGMDRDVQIAGLAASMPTDVLTGMVDLMEKKIIEYKVRPASNSTNWVTMIVHKDAMASYSNDSGDITTFGLGAFPQCPSAWAAFWAWFSFNAAVCGPFTAYPPAAFGCALGLGLAGTIIDFNGGC